MENVTDVTALMILFGTTLMGIIQVYQRNIKRHEDDTEEKNDELLEIERRCLRNELRVEMLEVRLDRRARKYKKLARAVYENVDADTLASIKNAIK